MFPGLSCASDGELVLTFSTMPDGLPGGEVQIIRSRDGGRGWSQPQVVAQALRPSAAVLGSYNPELPHGRYLAANLVHETG